MKAARSGLTFALDTLVLNVLLLLFVLRVVPFMTGLVPLTILGPSMGQSLPAGSLAYIDPKGAVEKGSIIAYATTTTVVTQRVIDIRPSVAGQGIEYVTKADDEAAPDRIPIPAENIAGVVTFHLPAIGYGAWGITQPMGMLFVLLAGLIIHNVRKLIPKPEPPDLPKPEPPDRHPARIVAT